VPQGSVRRIGPFLRAQRHFQDRVGLRVRGGAGGRPCGRGERLRSGPGGLRRASEIGDALLAWDRHGAYLLPKRGSRVSSGAAALDGGIRGAASCHPEEQRDRRARPRAGRRWASGKRQFAEGVIGQLKDFFDWSATGPRLYGLAADPLGGQGYGLHLRPTDQLLPWPTAAPLGGPVGLAHCHHSSKALPLATTFVRTPAAASDKLGVSFTLPSRTNSSGPPPLMGRRSRSGVRVFLRTARASEHG
jgi:hypothetical protein